MGNARYSVSDRDTRSVTLDYISAPVNAIFTQNVEQKAHPLMLPKDVNFRESRDSENHPLSTPIQFYLDVTGSMGVIPVEMIRTGLPKLMSSLIQNGVEDASLMFGAIGDHEYDNYPLQVGQFESGDAELDMWLTRTYLEGKGGGNNGESYLLAWYFAAFHVKTDAFEKRNQKGFVFTIGDEPCLPFIPISAIKAIMGNTAFGENVYKREELLAEAQKQNHVYHIHYNHGRVLDPAWKQMLGDNLIQISDHSTVARVISDIILSKLEKQHSIEIEPVLIKETNML